MLIRSSRGFTLIETLAALMVFTIVTLGVIPLLTASLRGTNLSRSHNVAKNLAVRAMERVRGLPYYLAYETQPTLGAGKVDVDVLDIYHPTPTNPSTIVCPAAGPPACPADIPDGYTLTFVATFVSSDGVTPVTDSSYDSNVANADNPPSDLMRMQIRVEWATVGGLARTFALNTLVGDRAFGRLKTKGTAQIDYGIRVGTSFVGTTAGGPVRSDLTALGGVSDSTIELRTNGAADQAVQAADLTLLHADDGSVLASGSGAVADAHAPPSSTVPDISATPLTVTAEGVGDVAGIDTTEAGDPDPEGDIAVAVENELPAAKGGFDFRIGGSGILDFWVDNPQVDRAANPDETLHLLSGAKLVSIQDVDNPTDIDVASGSVSGSTSSYADDEASGVHSVVRMDIESFRLLPTDFIGAVDNTYGGAVIAVDEFTARLTCDAYADTAAGTGDSAIEWSASLYFWDADAGSDNEDEDEDPNGAYRRIDLSGTGATPNSLADFGPGGTNPLVYRHPVDPTKDIYLFATGTNAGYLQSWSSDDNVASGANVSQDGRTATAVLERALQIDTAPIPASDGFNEFAMSVILGSLSCEAVDFR